MTRGMPFPESLAAITQHTSRAGRVTTHDTRGEREEGRGWTVFDRTRIKKIPLRSNSQGKENELRNITNGKFHGEKKEAIRERAEARKGPKNELRK